MSIDIIIKQKGLIKKVCPLDVILGKELRYGVYKQQAHENGPLEYGYRLHTDELGDGELVVFNPDHIGRGITVCWSPAEKEQISVHLLPPSTYAELKDLYAMVARISTHWNSTVEIDGEIMTPARFQWTQNQLTTYNEQILNQLFDDLFEFGHGHFASLFCAMWPLAFGFEDAEAASNDPRGKFAYFADWIHEKQSINAHYEIAKFFEDHDEMFGYYALRETVPTIFPLKAEMPLGISLTDKTGAPIDCHAYEIWLSSPDGVLGTFPYERFMNALDPQKVSPYDATHVFVEAHDLGEMKALLNRMQED